MSENRSNDTGQISVAELLARNGQKVSTRSGGRRRRGATGGISVAELTGEIPVTRAGESPDTEPPNTEPPNTGGSSSGDPAAPDTPTPTAGTPPVPAVPKKATAAAPKKSVPAVSKPAVSKPVVSKPAVSTPAVPKQKPALPADVEQTTVTESATAARPAPPKIESPTEIIRPDALPRRARAHLGTVAVSPSDTESPARPVGARAANAVEPRLLSGPASDLRGTGSGQDDSTDTFGTPTAPPVGKVDAKNRTPEPGSATKGSARPSVDSGSPRAGKRASKGAAAAEQDRDAGSGGAERKGERRAAAEQTAADDTVSESGLKQWVLLIGESIAAIIAGGLLFKGFERLWDLMPWIAFALALLVIVGLVALVRVLRRTDDITSQLIALAVGAFVSFGPLLFLLPG